MQKIYKAQHIFNIITKEGTQERTLATEEKMPVLVVNDKNATLEFILEGMIFQEIKRFVKVSKILNQWHDEDDGSVLYCQEDNKLITAEIEGKILAKSLVITELNESKDQMIEYFYDLTLSEFKY